MKKKSNLIIILTVLLLAIIGTSYAYSRYASAILGTSSITQASWDIKVNGCNIVHPENNSGSEIKKCFDTKEITEDETTIYKISRNYYVDDEDIIFDIKDYKDGSVSTLGSGVIAPGTEASFDIEIDASETNVAFKYEVKTTFISSNNYIKVYISSEKSPTEVLFVPEYTLQGKIYNNDADKTETLHIRIVWENDETGSNNQVDTEMGLIPDNKLAIPIYINFEQILSD